MIIAKIDFRKIDQSKLFPGKNGAQWLDIVLYEIEPDQYGNEYRVEQGKTKEERLAKTKGLILGNAKKFGSKPKASVPTPQRAQTESKPASDDDCPF